MGIESDLHVLARGCRALESELRRARERLLLIAAKIAGASIDDTDLELLVGLILEMRTLDAATADRCAARGRAALAEVRDAGLAAERRSSERRKKVAGELDKNAEGTVSEVSSSEPSEASAPQTAEAGADTAPEPGASISAGERRSGREDAPIVRTPTPVPWRLPRRALIANNSTGPQ